MTCKNKLFHNNAEDKQQSFPWSITSPSSLSAPTLPTATISPSVQQMSIQQQQSQPITENILQLHNLANNVDSAQLMAQQQLHQQHPRQGSGSS